MPLKSKIVLSVTGFASGVGGAKFGFGHGEPEPEVVITKEREEFARRASVYTVYYENIAVASDGKKYPNIKKVSLTPLSNVVLESSKELQECELKGNAQDRVYAFGDPNIKLGGCDDYFQHKDGLSESKDNLEKSEFISEAKILEDMENVTKMKNLLLEYEKEVNEDDNKVESKCLGEYSKFFDDAETNTKIKQFCGAVMSYIGYQ